MDGNVDSAAFGSIMTRAVEQGPTPDLMLELATLTHDTSDMRAVLYALAIGAADHAPELTGSQFFVIPPGTLDEAETVALRPIIAAMNGDRDDALWLSILAPKGDGFFDGQVLGAAFAFSVHVAREKHGLNTPTRKRGRGWFSRLFHSSH